MIVLIRGCCFLYRAVGMLAVFVILSADYWLRPSNRRGIAARARWLQGWCRRTLRILGIRTHASGIVPDGGVLVANHLSYVDMLVLSAQAPQIFVAKMDVRGWPLFGAFARWSGTLFIDRRKRSDVARQGSEFLPVVEGGNRLTLFLEGTSSDGATVLPFRSSLLEPVVQQGWAVYPVALHYACAYADPGDAVCYWRDMTLGPHLLRLMTLPRVDAYVDFGVAVEAGLDRKQLALTLRDEVARRKAILETLATESHASPSGENKTESPTAVR